MKVSNRYSGASGLYASVRPIKGFSKLSQRMLETVSFGHPITDQDELHCTLIYSRNVAPHVTKAARLLNEGPYTFHAVSKCVRWWTGHDNDGYLVLEMESPDLTARHLAWKQIGAEHSFPDYIPHITLATGVPEPEKYWMKNLNLMLRREAPTIIFGAEHCEDIKP